MSGENMPGDKFRNAFADEEAAHDGPPGASQIFPALGALPPVPRRPIVPSGALVKTTGENVQIGGITMTPKGLIVADGVSLADWEAAGHIFQQLERALAWIIGDWANCGQRIYGKGYDEAAKLVGRSQGTVYNWGSVCARVNFSLRREKLPFTHHVEVAPLEPDAQEYFLGLAEQYDLSKRQLHEAIEAWKRGADERAIILLISGNSEGESCETPELFSKSVKKIFKRLECWDEKFVREPDNQRYCLEEIQTARQLLDEWEAWVNQVEGR